MSEAKLFVFGLLKTSAPFFGPSALGTLGRSQPTLNILNLTTRISIRAHATSMV
jgi:hypothetical protein